MVACLIVGNRANCLFIAIVPLNISTAYSPLFSYPSFSSCRYLLFRTMGLRHLPVIDGDNQPIGMITRKDLMAFNIDESISGHHHSHSASPFGPGGGTETVNPIDGVEMSESKQDLKMS